MDQQATTQPKPTMATNVYICGGE